MRRRLRQPAWLAAQTKWLGAVIDRPDDAVDNARDPRTGREGRIRHHVLLDDHKLPEIAAARHFHSSGGVSLCLCVWIHILDPGGTFRLDNQGADHAKLRLEHGVRGSETGAAELDRFPFELVTIPLQFAGIPIEIKGLLAWRDERVHWVEPDEKAVGLTDEGDHSDASHIVS